ncbi:MAG: SGNH/GDSL hydrolase family protein [Trueperaceae bacterium]
MTAAGGSESVEFERTVLCYGDSNTWGFDPNTKERFPRRIRWTGVLQELLGSKVHVVEEGLNSRTTVFEDPLQPGRKGIDYLLPCLDSHAPLHLVLLMLGTNDLKARFSLSPKEIALGVSRLIGVILSSASGPAQDSPGVLLLSPPLIGRLSEFAEFFDGAEKKSRQLGASLREVALEHGCDFLDVAQHVKASEHDGVHLDAGAHAVLARTVADEVTELLR